ncbi:MAG: adenylate/guanylate cyclase domain-containing protein [Pseudomonadota bacterium]
MTQTLPDRTAERPGSDQPEIEERIRARAFPVVSWLLQEGRFITSPDEATLGYADRLLGAGVPVDRMMSAMPTLHAERRGLGRLWDSRTGVREVIFPWDNLPAYEASPYALAHRTGDWVRIRLAETDDSAFGIVSELRADGIVDYVCIPIIFHDGTEGGMTYATRAASGFSDDELKVIAAVEPAMAMMLDLKRASRLVNETLKMYVGSEPHARIVSGEVRRGGVQATASALLMADIRGFTALAANMTPEETVDLLNRYFDCVVPQIEAAGGEVLKYIGDGVLAIFRGGLATGYGGNASASASSAAQAALDAARGILKAVDAASDGTNQPAGSPAFDIKMGLHVGEVAYGNIGSGARLDFTVVGQGVNLVSRLTDLCGALDQRLVVSKALADYLPDQTFTSLGHHPLKGLTEPQEALKPESVTG